MLSVPKLLPQAGNGLRCAWPVLLRRSFLFLVPCQLCPEIAVHVDRRLVGLDGRFFCLTDILLHGSLVLGAVIWFLRGIPQARELVAQRLARPAVMERAETTHVLLAPTHARRARTRHAAESPLCATDHHIGPTSIDRYAPRSRRRGVGPARRRARRAGGHQLRVAHALEWHRTGARRRAGAATGAHLM